MVLPVFLFAGQSNMVGHPDHAGNSWAQANDSAGGLTTSSLLSHLQQAPVAWSAVESLILQAESATPERALHETNELAAMYEQDPLFYETSGSTCWFVQPTRRWTTGGSASLDNLCGQPWGLEVSFAATFDEPHAVIKVAVGGTEIDKDWSKPGSNYWNNLVETIQRPLDTKIHKDCVNPGDCAWQGIVWFQGENDGFALDTAESYHDHLRQLVSDLRQELHKASPYYDHAYQNPVVIVGMGAWAQSMPYGKVVYQAQADYLREDDYAGGIPTDDLSSFYHYDAASLLILGHRVATTLQLMMMSEYPDNITAKDMESEWMGPEGDNGKAEEGKEDEYQRADKDQNEAPPSEPPTEPPTPSPVVYYSPANPPVYVLVAAPPSVPTVYQTPKNTMAPTLASMQARAPPGVVGVQDDSSAPAMGRMIAMIGMGLCYYW